MSTVSTNRSNLTNFESGFGYTHEHSQRDREREGRKQRDNAEERKGERGRHLLQLELQRATGRPNLVDGVLERLPADVLAVDLDQYRPELQAVLGGSLRPALHLLDPHCRIGSVLAPRNAQRTTVDESHHNPSIEALVSA